MGNGVHRPACRRSSVGCTLFDGLGIVHTRQTRVNIRLGTDVVKGYTLASFQDAFARYIP